MSGFNVTYHSIPFPPVYFGEARSVLHEGGYVPLSILLLVEQAFSDDLRRF
jgi:hypothetical protein